MKFKPLLYLFIIHCLITCISCTAQDVKIAPLFKCSPKLKHPYGLCSHVDCTEESLAMCEIKAMKDLGVECIRTDFGPYDFKIVRDTITGAKRISNIIRSLEDHNFDLLTIVGASSRRWALTDTTAYFTFLEQLLDMYPKVPYWEVLNEVDLERGIDNKTELYAQLLKSSFGFIKSTDKNKLVLYSGVTPSSMSFNDSVFNCVDMQCFDVMNMHTYSAPEKIYEELKVLKDVLSKHNYDCPVWITECGYPTAAQKLVTRDNKEKEQAIRLPRTYLICFASGVDKVFWYNSVASEEVDDDIEDHFGIFHKDYTQKPACKSFSALMKMCPSGSDRPNLNIQNGLYLCEWRKPNGRHIYAIWSLKNTTVKVVTKGRYNTYDYNGQKMKPNPKNLRINNQITYFEGSRNFSLTIQ